MCIYTAHYVDKRDTELAESFGASRFIIKPISPLDILYEIDQVNKNGNIVHLETVRSPLIIESGDIIAHIGVFRDITDRKQAEEDIRKLNAELENKIKTMKE